MSEPRRDARSRRNRGAPLAAAATLLLLTGFQTVDRPRDWSFPRDHGAHPGFQTEWWYVTGHLKNDSGASYGYELVFFRRTPDPPADLKPVFQGFVPADFYPAHCAVTDETGRRFFHDQKFMRSAGDMAGSDTTRLDVHCGDWFMRMDSDTSFALEGSAGPFRLTLNLLPRKPTVLNGPGGVSRKGPAEGQASYYYSWTRLATRGSISGEKTSQEVTGVSWLDHEFFSANLDSSLAGWDWFSLQLDDDTEVMLYRLRGKAGPEQDHLSGTWVAADGKSRTLGPADFSIETTGRWTSPATKIDYPAAWTVKIPSIDLNVKIVPTVSDQELDTRRTTRVVYWEGSVQVSGTRGGRTVTGAGYVELTGYDGQVPMESPRAEGTPRSR